MPIFLIKHLTKFSSQSLVINETNKIRLHPIEDGFQTVVSHNLRINTNPKTETSTDLFGNTVTTFNIKNRDKNLSINSITGIITKVRTFPDDLKPATEQWKALKSLKHKAEFTTFLKFKNFDGSAFTSELLKTKDLTKVSPFKIILELCEYIFKSFKYQEDITNEKSKLDQVWALQTGNCYAFANILLQMARIIGIPARYVSGYIYSNNSDYRGRLHTHAWVDVYIPFYGWLGIDPTNNIIANEHHICLAIGKEYEDCSPININIKHLAKFDLTEKTEISTYKTKKELLLFLKKESEILSNDNIKLIQQQQQQ